MIKRLKYHEIDFEKYTNCVEQSVQRKYSATTFFLDVVSQKNWQLLVYKDYDAVMPFITTRKIGIEMVANPLLCQQLGVFSKEDRKDVNQLFYNYLNKKLNLWHYAFNDANTISENLKERKNYIIFPKPYEEVLKNYSPKRRRKIRQTEEIKQHSYINKNVEFEAAKGFIENYSKGITKKKNLKQVLQVYKDFHIHNRLIFYGYFYKGELINLLAFYIDEKTIALLGTFNHPKHIKISGSSILIDEMMKTYVENKIIDFEGGELPNIEEFFKGFGAVLKPYKAIVNSKKNVVKNLLNFKF